MVSINSGRLSYANTFGYNWASTAKAYTDANAATAYFLYFGVADANPADGPYNRWRGHSLRCWAATSLDVYEYI